MKIAGIAAAFVFFAWLTAGAVTVHADEPAAITVLSFNIRYDNPDDGDNRWEPRRSALHPDATEVGTYNGWTGGMNGEKIDYIFVSHGIEVLDAGILNETIQGRLTSDHFPVYAKLRVANRQLGPGNQERQQR